jgi:hypothetical protein
MAIKKTPPKPTKKAAVKAAPKAPAKGAAKSAAKAVPPRGGKKAAPPARKAEEPVSLDKTELLALIDRLSQIIGIVRNALETFDGKKAVLKPGTVGVMILKPHNTKKMTSVCDC